MPATSKMNTFFQELLKNIPDHVWRSQTDYIRANAAAQGEAAGPFGINTNYSENGPANPTAQEGVGCISFVAEKSQETVEKGVRLALSKMGIKFPTETKKNKAGDDSDEDDYGNEDYFDDDDPEPLISDSLDGYRVELHLTRYEFAPTFMIFRGNKGDKDTQGLLESAAKSLAATFKSANFSIGVVPYTSKTLDATIGESKMKLEIVCGVGPNMQNVEGPAPGVRMELKHGDQVVAVAVLSVRNCQVDHVGPTLENIAVHKNFRRKGVGTWMFSFIEKWVLEHWVTPTGYLHLSFCDITGNYKWFQKRGVRIDLDEGMKVLKRPSSTKLVL
jgi:ribosomal protein S18 acetylase RimI-like enzyme